MSLASLTWVLGNLIPFLRERLYPRPPLPNWLSDNSRLDRWLYFRSEDCPIASATSLTGKLNAAKYYFLVSTYCECSLLIYSSIFTSYFWSSYSYFILSSFFLLISITFWACSRYKLPIFYFQYCMYLYLAFTESSAIFFFLSFWCDRNWRSISSIFFLCSCEIFFNSRASSSLTR